MSDSFEAPKKSPLMGFEQFVERTKKGNFHMYFEPGYIADVYRQSPAYQRYSTNSEFQVLAQELQVLLANETPTVEEETEKQRKLYNAYTMMHPLAKHDGELFG